VLTVMLVVLALALKPSDGQQVRCAPRVVVCATTVIIDGGATGSASVGPSLADLADSVSR
jgi:hypothetical protein